MSRVYTIVGGVNGVGKSSFIGVLKSQRNDLGYIIDVDRLATKCGNNNLLAGRQALNMIDSFLDRGISFTQETTLSGSRTLKTIKRAMAESYTVRLYYIGLNSCEESLYRIQNRVRHGGHDIPPRDVQHRYSKRFGDLLKVLPYCNEVYFFDNYNGFNLVATYRNQEVVPQILPKDFPQWFTELYDAIANSSIE